MDELVKQQMQQRAYEMSLIPPPIGKISQPATQPPLPLPPANTFVQNNVQTTPPKLQIDASSNIEISIEEIGSAGNKKSVTWKTGVPDINDVNRLDAEILVLRESINNMTEQFSQLKQLFESSQTSIAELKEANVGLATKLNDTIEFSKTSIAELKEANVGLATKLNRLVEWSQNSIAELTESNAGLATKLNNSVEWSHLSIVHLNEANTRLEMKLSELLANQRVIQQPELQTHIPSPDEIKSTMERILTQMDGE
jgi:chromosome segregation ATPase